MCLLVWLNFWLTVCLFVFDGFPWRYIGRAGFLLNSRLEHRVIRSHLQILLNELMLWLDHLVLSNQALAYYLTDLFGGKFVLLRTSKHFSEKWDEVNECMLIFFGQLRDDFLNHTRVNMAFTLIELYNWVQNGYWQDWWKQRVQEIK